MDSPFTIATGVWELVWAGSAAIRLEFEAARQQATTASLFLTPFKNTLSIVVRTFLAATYQNAESADLILADHLLQGHLVAGAPDDAFPAA